MLLRAQTTLNEEPKGVSSFVLKTLFSAMRWATQRKEAKHEAFRVL